MKHLAPKTKKTDITAIRSYYKGEVDELTDHQQEVKKRLLQAQSLLCQGEPTFLIINVLMDVYHVSEAQAFRDLRAATSLYGDMRKAEKEGIRWILYDMFMEDYTNARKNGDSKALPGLQKNLLIVTGTDRENPDTPDFEKLEPTPIVLMIPEQMQDKINLSLQKGVSDLTELFLQEKNTIDVPHQEVTDAESEGGAEAENNRTRD